MNIRHTILALLLCLSLPAAAEFKTIALAYEIALSDLRVPVSQNGSLMFRECADCEMLIVRMTAATGFIVNGENVELKEFRKRVFHVRNRAAETVIVKHHLQSDTIVYLSVNL